MNRIFTYGPMTLVIAAFVLQAFLPDRSYFTAPTSNAACGQTQSKPVAKAVSVTLPFCIETEAAKEDTIFGQAIRAQVRVSGSGHIRFEARVGTNVIAMSESEVDMTKKSIARVARLVPERAWMIPAGERLRITVSGKGTATIDDEAFLEIANTNDR